MEMSSSIAKKTPLKVSERDTEMDGELQTPDGQNSKNKLSKDISRLFGSGGAMVLKKDVSKKSKNESKMPSINDQCVEANIPKHIQDKIALVKQTGPDQVQNELDAMDKKLKLNAEKSQVVRIESAKSKRKVTEDMRFLQ